MIKIYSYKGSKMKIKMLIVALLFSVNSLVYAGIHGNWGYSGDGNPAHWGDVKPEFFMCRDGKNQSPINIQRDETILANGLEDIEFHYVTGATEAVNNGHTIKVSVAPGSYIKVDGIEFELKQFHFHSPSENQINGKNFPLEAHFVHASKDGELAVVSVMYEQSKENKILKKICSKIFSNPHEKTTCSLNSKDINTLLPVNKGYYRFDGSLTTPPCSEGVRWLVLKDYSHVSAAQAKKFVNVMMKGRNNRPVQQLNARKVLKNQ